jgi:hypothetical protein
MYSCQIHVEVEIDIHAILNSHPGKHITPVVGKRSRTRLLQVQELAMSLELLEPRIQLFISGGQCLEQGLLLLDFLVDSRLL